MWQVDTEDRTVDVIHVDPKETREERIGDWRLYTDTGLLDRLAELRRGRLPAETGGVLLGAYDMERKIIYMVATVPSPPDSEEWPTAYIRGSKGLSQKVGEIREATDGMLDYIGEWHSHPRRSDVTPSDDDKVLLAWLGDLMDHAGLPGVLAIVGDDGQLGLALGGQAAAESATI